MEIKFTETVLRDANQSLMATRLRLSDFEEILPILDKCGFWSVECWGGATFDSCLRYLDEDPWERLRRIRTLMPETKLQMLLRGQNLLGYRHYSDDVVRRFVQCSVKNGIDIIRVFDALNDAENLKTAIEETAAQGASASGAVCYTVSPVHTREKYVALAREIKEMGAESICIKDMAGILAPDDAYDLVSAMKDALDMPVILHTHCTTGLAYMTCLKAAEAGVDVIDTAISAFSGGSSQPATETMAYALSRMGRESQLDSGKLRQVNDYFKPIREKYIESGVMSPAILGTDADALIWQIPGGMLSNLISQLSGLGASERLSEVLEEVPKVRRDMGYPPLVTPMSQMVGAQALSNVLTGERYKTVSKEVRSYLRGEYGMFPGQVAEQLLDTVRGEQTSQSAQTMTFEAAESELGTLAENEEDVLSFIAFPQSAMSFFKKRRSGIGKKVKYTVEPVRGNGK